MIEVDLELPLAAQTLRVAASLPSGLTAVMGPSGAGKTSLLECVAGLRPKARGRVAVDGVTLMDTARGLRTPPEQRRVGYVPQEAALFPHLTVLGNVSFGARGDRAGVESAMDALEIRGLRERYPATLSGGEKRRVALARALAAAPRVLLLDEPLAALDVGHKERIVPYLVRIREQWRLSVLHVTHSVGEALALAGHVLLLREGAVEAQGAPGELLSAAGLVREAEEGIDNLFSARVLSHDPEGGVTRLGIDGGPMASVPLSASRAVGERVTLVVRAEDVLVATEEPVGLSARNVYEASVVSIERTGADALLRCAAGSPAATWMARVTPSAVAALGLRPGRTVWLAVKSHSARVL